MNPFPNVSAAQLCHYHDKAVSLKQKHLIRAQISCGHSNNDLVLISLISSHWSWNEATWGSLTWHAFLIFIFKSRFKAILSIQVQGAIIIHFLGCRTRLSLHNCQKKKKKQTSIRNTHSPLSFCTPPRKSARNCIDQGTLISLSLFSPQVLLYPKIFRGLIIIWMGEISSRGGH